MVARSVPLVSAVTSSPLHQLYCNYSLLLQFILAVCEMHCLLLTGVINVLLRSRNLPRCVLHFTDGHLPKEVTHALGVAWGIEVFRWGYCLDSTAPRPLDTVNFLAAISLACTTYCMYCLRKTLGDVYEYYEDMLVNSRLAHTLQRHAKNLMAAVASCVRCESEPFTAQAPRYKVCYMYICFLKSCLASFASHCFLSLLRSCIISVSVILSLCCSTTYVPS